MMDEPWSGLVIADLLGRGSTLKDEDGWEPFRPGVDIRTLYPDRGDGASAALLRYRAGASVLYHEHLGYEHILVLDGAQSDERGRYPAGTLVINPAGSSHRVWSDIGCVVLIIWQREIRIIPSCEPTLAG
jgi:anti-sigma factor ChrR (cupin superfamily)